MQSIILGGSVISFLGGVVLRTIYEVSLELPILVLVLSFIFGLMWRRKSFTFSTPHLLLISLCLLFFAFGIVRTEIASWQFDSSALKNQLTKTVAVEGVVSKEPDYRETTVHLHIETGSDLLLVTTDKFTEVNYGDRLEVSGTLTKPETFTTDLGRTFNYPGYLKAKGIEYVISFAEVEVIESGQGNYFISNLLSLKKNFIKSIQSIIPEPAVGLGSGLLLGVKSSLGDDIEQDFRRTGIIHVVVLSGYNVMLVVTFIMFVFSFILPIRFRILAGIVAIIAFALIVGLSATVIRASVMACLVLTSQVLGRRYNVMRALILAGALMVVINPYLLISDIGFQLSFVATLGLILIVPQFEFVADNSKKILGLREFFLATLSTQIAVLPLLMFHIGEVSLIAMVVNILVLPVVPLAMLLTFVTGMLGFIFLPAATMFGYFATLSLSYILWVAKWFGSATYASIAVPQFSVVGVVLMYLAMFLVWYFIKTRGSSIDALSGWEIETEEAVKVRLKNSELNTQEEPPIFFR